MDRRQIHIRLTDIYKGKDIYVLGSGHSMQYVNPSFFEGKITIGTNFIWKHFPLSYVVIKHKELVKELIVEAIQKGIVTIISKHDCGDLDHEENETIDADFVFTHKRGRFVDQEGNFAENIDSVGKDPDIFVSYSTITSCIHLAAYMGAKNIIICGHDCGYIDRKSHIKDYGKHIEDYYGDEGKFNEYHNKWFANISDDTERLKKKLKEVYGCEIYSLNPFINYRLEGHKYSETQ